MLIFFRTGFTHRRGYVSGGHVGEGLAARSPDRRLGDPRGVPGNPERDLKLVCGGRMGAIRVSSSRARDVWRTAKKYQNLAPKIARAGKDRRGAHRSASPPRSSAWRSRRSSDRHFPCRPRRRRTSRRFHPQKPGITGRCPPGLPIVPRILTTTPCFAAMCAAATVTGGTLQRLHPLLSHEVLHVRVMRRLKHRPGLIVVEVERVTALPPAVCDVQAQPTPLVTRHTVRVRAKKHPAPRERETGGSNRRFKP